MRGLWGWLEAERCRRESAAPPAGEKAPLSSPGLPAPAGPAPTWRPGLGLEASASPRPGILLN